MIGNIHCDFESVQELEEFREQLESGSCTGVSSENSHAIIHYDTSVPLTQSYQPATTEQRVAAARFDQAATERQIGGDYYKSLKIQPHEYIEANSLPFLEGNVVKYVTRHASKNGVQDIDKAIHYLELIKQMRYSEETTSDQ
ncbi:protein of unknown function DUF3310 [Vibrio phage 1.271.B._10N.286.54.B4]|nr:protein of unknown function DUF3310 [Vibrio phage 1.027.O._10N.286.54.B8]AUR92386.1 protein of unknown function DUF3310 [Vibrio phage 1.171.O._10N.261.52.F12]AUR94439.1 protein of unknown function DUF3310 [Vibrio phage 1.194.O._10N.286.54.B1]AUR94527.1 protein of unknown function DUF3310 [Vibrio phage 1.195.O._10N.286.54.C8]AUR94612.1 protein of unknown function DUF3310 [Vibrio phage 1.196.O._10N.286.54.E12]AUR95079.1 protein of unknown function DUF3310 [Vibrio phage 1.200.O._10N.286.55.E1]